MHMARGEQRETFETIREHAFRSLTAEARLTTNLHIDRRVREPGEPLGPAFQNLKVERPSLLVFADDAPLANFGHPCRYLLYDPDKAVLHTEIAARFPPYQEAKPPETMTLFHEPVRVQPNPEIFRLPPILRC